MNAADAMQMAHLLMTGRTDCDAGTLLAVVVRAFEPWYARSEAVGGTVGADVENWFEINDLGEMAFSGKLSVFRS